MTNKETKQKGEGEARVEGSQGFGEMCREMMARGGCDCCGPQMREMMRSGSLEGCGPKMREMTSRFRAPATEAEGEGTGQRVKDAAEA